MTSQTRRFIEFPDIVGVQIECKKCGVSLLVSGATLVSLADPHNQTLFQCPTCQTGWTVPRGYPVQMSFDNEVKKFVRLLNDMQRLEEQLGCHLRLELKNESSEKS